MEQTDLIRGESFALDDCRCEWAFLPAAPANQNVALLSSAKLACGLGVLLLMVCCGSKQRRQREFAKVGASALTPALVKYSVREAGSANSGDNGNAEPEIKIGCFRAAS